MAQQHRTIPRVCVGCGSDFLAASGQVKRGKALYCKPGCWHDSLRSAPPAAEVRPDGTARVPVFDRFGEIVAYALVDASDAALVTRWRWRLRDGYAVRNGTAAEGQRHRHLSMARLIVGLPNHDPRVPDHINRDRLDNRRSNLRIVTKHGNAQNRPSLPGSISQLRGVTWHKQIRKWMASVMVGGKSHHLGYFTDEAEAGAAALEARRRLLPFAVD